MVPIGAPKKIGCRGIRYVNSGADYFGNNSRI